MMRKKTIELRVTPENKESTCNNTFNLVNVLAAFCWIAYNFTIEFSNWDKLTASFQTTKHTEVEGNTTYTWIVNQEMEAQSQIVRLEEVCKNVATLNLIFIGLLALTAIYSMVMFVRRQYKIVNQAFACTDIGWFFSIIFLISGTAVQSMVGLFIIILLSPTSFLTCYTNIARFYCTIALSVLFVFFLYNIILVSLLRPILCHTIQYSQLQEVGRNCEVDVVRTNARKKYKDNKYEDNEEEVALNDVNLDDNTV